MIKRLLDQKALSEKGFSTREVFYKKAFQTKSVQPIGFWDKTFDKTLLNQRAV